MYIAVSDYDGTLGDFDGVKPEVIRAIHNWREAKNLFGIATGRSLPMIDFEVTRNGIPFDFLICCNGAGIFDANRDIMVANYLPPDLLPTLIDDPAVAPSLHVVLCYDKKLAAICQDEDNWLFRVGIPVKRILRGQVELEKPVLQLSLSYPSPEESQSAASALLERYAPRIQVHPNGTCLDITVSGVDKGEAVARMVEAKNWQGGDVLVIGDGENDLSMIARFHGFTVPGGKPEIKAVARNVFPDVAAMLDAFL